MHAKCLGLYKLSGMLMHNKKLVLCMLSIWYYASLVCDSMHAKYVIICMINKLFYAYLTSGFMHV